MTQISARSTGMEHFAGDSRRWNYEWLFIQSIAIVSVVLGHVGNRIPVFYNEIFPYSSWHMPVFVFASGYFFTAKGTYGTYVKKKLKSLLLPAWLVHAVVLGYGALLRNAGVSVAGGELSLYALLIDPFVECASAGFDVSIWFIFQLFLIEMLAFPLAKIPWGRACRWGIMGSLAVCLVTLAWVAALQGNLPKGWTLTVSRTCFLQFFFVAGYWYRRHGESLWRGNPAYPLMAVVLVQGIYRVWSGSGIDFYPHVMMTGATPAFFTPLLTTGTALVALISLARMLRPALQGNVLVRWIGGNTKAIVYFHQLCMLLVNCAFIIIQSRWNPALLQGFEGAQALGNAWYAFQLGGKPLGQLPYVLSGIILPIGFMRCIAKVHTRWMRGLLWCVIALAVGIFLLNMSYYL